MLKKDSPNSLNHEQISSSTIEAIPQEISHRELADKVMAGKRLTSAEKSEIYRLLTGFKPNRKRKLTKLDVRNANLAADYLTQASEANGKLSDTRSTLAKQYELPGLENCSNETFYKAVSRGIEILGDHCSKQLDIIKKNPGLNSNEKDELFDMIESFLDSEKKYTSKSNRTISKTDSM